MQHTPVTSSSLTSVAHEGDVLEVRFANGGHYRLTGVSAELFGQLLAAESKGQFFASRLRGKFPHERIEPDPHAADAVTSDGAV